MIFKRQRYVVTLFLSVAFVLFVMLTATISLTWRESNQLSKSVNDNAIWGSTQLESQLLKLSYDLDQYGHESSGVTKDDLLLRMDLVWSRLNVFKGGEVYKFYSMTPRIFEVLKSINDRAQEIEKRILALDDKTRSMAFVLSHDVSQLVPNAHMVGLDTFHTFNADTVFSRNILRSNIRQSLIYLFGILICSLVIGGLWVFQTRRVNAISNARNEALIEAESANRAKTDFLASMNHELRTPLNAINGFSYMLGSISEGQLSEKQKEYIGYISESGAYLENLIGQVLDLSNIEAGKLDIRYDFFNICDVVDECLTIIKPAVKKNNITVVNRLTSRHLSDIETDRTRVKQVLMNLISNAVKYNSQNGMVVIDAEELPDDRVLIIVEDNGPGVPEHKIDRLFDPFDRLGREAHNIEGMGIGLTITKKIVEALGGEMGVDSIVGSGCRFWINVPSRSHLKE